MSRLEYLYILVYFIMESVSACALPIQCCAFARDISDDVAFENVSPDPSKGQQE